MAPRGRPRSTHCPQGHEWTEENTYVAPDGKRRCQECRRLRKGNVARAAEPVLATVEPTPEPQQQQQRRTRPPTHCGQGHEFTEANTYVRKVGSYECVECSRIRKGYEPRI